MSSPRAVRSVPTAAPWLLAAGLAAASAASATGLAAQEAPAPMLPIDQVAATVNDAVVLYSELLAASVGEFNTMEAVRGRPLLPQEREAIVRRNLDLKIEQHALAQAAKTLGVVPPERVEAVLQEQIEEDEREQIRALGSYQRVSEERARQNQSWESYYREQRVKILAQFAREIGVHMRLQNQRNLFITPRMMREFYREHRSDYVHEGSSAIALVGFPGNTPQETMLAAAEAWRQESMPVAQLVARFADRGAYPVFESMKLDDAARQRFDASIVGFGLAGPKDAVSGPMPLGPNFVLCRVIQFVPPASGSFADPEVQEDIRRRLEGSVEANLARQTLLRAMERTQVWPRGAYRGSSLR